MPTIIPVYHGHSHCNRPMTEHESKVMLGCFIILSFIWVVSSIISIVKFYKNRKIYYYENFWEVYFDDNIIQGVLHFIMTFLSIVIALIYLGSLIAKLL